jgi:hypothetical protein
MTKEKKEKSKKEVQKAEIKESTFIAKAKRKGITSSQLQENVLAEPDKYDEKTLTQANLRKTLVKLNNRKKEKAS